jgi:hypothetical protein
MIDIGTLTINEAREIAALVGAGNGAVAGAPFVPGKAYFIRTVTHSYTGRCVRCGPQFVTLVDAAWIADTGRFADAMKSGEYTEVEPWPDGREINVGLGAICEFSEANQIPRSQK